MGLFNLSKGLLQRPILFLPQRNNLLVLFEQKIFKFPLFLEQLAYHFLKRQIQVSIEVVESLLYYLQL